MTRLTECSPLKLAEYQRGIVPAETERIGHGMVDLRLARLIWDVIQVTFGIGGLIVDRGRDHTLAHGQDTAPEAPSRCPVMDFVEDTGIL